MAEAHTEENCEESPQLEEPISEDQDTQDERIGRSEPTGDERDHDVGTEGDESEETDETTLNIEGIFPPVEETRESEQEQVTTNTP